MGLAARILEAAGIATVCLSMIPTLTAAAGAPRVAAIEHPFSRPMGMVGDAERQSGVLRGALGVLESAERYGTVVELPFRWPEPRGVAIGKLPNPPIAALCKRKPWLFLDLVRGKIPEAATT